MESPENISGQEVGVEQDATPTLVDVDTALLLLGAGVTAITHPLLYVKLLIQVGHEPLPPTVGTTMFGRRVLYLPGFFSYAHHIVKVDGKRGLFRGLSPRIVSSAISTVVRSKVKQVELLSKRDELQTSLRKVVKETSHEMIIQCLSRVATHPFHVMSVRCMAQFVGREVKYGGIFSCIVKIFKEEGVAGFYVGLIPHVAGEVLFLWFCNLLAHFINTYAVDESVSPSPLWMLEERVYERQQAMFTQASAIRSYTKFVMGIAVSALTYPFMLVADIMAVNNCGLAAGLPPHSPIFKSWLQCWNHLSHKDQLFRGSSFFFRRVPVTSRPSTEG
ncbi:mitochondrial carrier homolog 1 isoform X2 [Sander lucioperca]|uniref:mitochondrial carrier homolog 1 isoform X2 n=1 Tax=Sander lucioperca TaxID=283035 RepID=UPI001653AA6F|nr:mitochondrial carrier homolog 1 isoform X2 [Sander lucioperca]